MMIKHEHYIALVTLRDMSEKSSHTDQLGSYTEALNAAIVEFQKTGSTIEKMGLGTRQVEHTCMEIIQQTHLHPELVGKVLKHFTNLYEELRQTDFFKDSGRVE